MLAERDLGLDSAAGTIVVVIAAIKRGQPDRSELGDSRGREPSSLEDGPRGLETVICSEVVIDYMILGIATLRTFFMTAVIVASSCNVIHLRTRPAIAAVRASKSIAGAVIVEAVRLPRIAQQGPAKRYAQRLHSICHCGSLGRHRPPTRTA